MAAPEGPKVRKTTSKCTATTDRCSHMFEIHGYSLYEGLGSGTPVSSATFAVGSYDWQISCYPDGYYRKDCEGYASIYLNLMSKASQDTKVRGFANFRLVNPNTGQTDYRFGIRIEHTMQDNCSFGCGRSRFIKRSEMSRYLRNNCLTIECDVSIIVASTVSKQPETICEIQVPPSDLSENLGMLLHTKEGADVTIKIKGEVFHAHKVVLAMRSLVFRALYGFVGKKNRHSITIEDMEPAVFKALLHFICTDSLPANDGLDGERVKLLIAAADRYAMERMKLVCESILCKRLDLENVADTLVLADRHYCFKLKDACIKFINTSNRIKDVMASQGYEHLKKACPSVVTKLLEEVAKSSVC